jgi:hypothetical protein
MKKNVDEKTKNLQRSIFLNIIENDLESIKNIISENPQLEIEDFWFCEIAYRGRVNILRFFVEDVGLDINKVGYDMLYFASLVRNLIVIRYIISAGINYMTSHHHYAKVFHEVLSDVGLNFNVLTRQELIDNLSLIIVDEV